MKSIEGTVFGILAQALILPVFVYFGKFKWRFG